MQKILFIGNSHTYFNDMPAMVAQLFSAVLGEEAHVTMLASPGMSLRWHYDQPETKFNILRGGYDYVVLQQATHPFDGEEALLRQAGRLIQWVREAKATPVVYMTWSAKDDLPGQKELTDAFRHLAETGRALLAPAGEVWEAVRKVRPGTELYFRDGRHASPLGSAIAAASIFSAITGAPLPGADSPYWTERGAGPETVRLVQAVLDGIA